MIVATVKEKNEFENRVSITPDTCKSFIKAGLDVIIEKNAGYNASFLDNVYKESGADVLDREQVLKKADILVSVSTILENSDLDNIGTPGCEHQTLNVRELRQQEHPSFYHHGKGSGEHPCCWKGKLDTRQGV